MSEQEINSTEQPEEQSAAPVEAAVEAPVESAAPATDVEFLDTLAEDLRGQSNLKDFKDVNDLAKSYVNLQRMVGNSVRIPAEDASSEAKQDFLEKIKDYPGVLIEPTEGGTRDDIYNKLGRPETKDDYNLDAILQNDMVQDVPEIQDQIHQFTEIAHQIGLSDDQTTGLINFKLAEYQQATSALELSKDEGESKLRTMWGQDYDNRLSAAKKMAGIYAEKYGDEVTELINGPSGNNPAFLNMLSELAGTYKEQGHDGLQQSNFGMTPDMALSKIAEKKSDSGFMKAYTDSMNPGHKNAMEQLTKLYAIANGA